jgi:hypothetical protein
MSKRFEVHISPDRRAALDALARELGCSSSDLARLGVTWILRKSRRLVGGPPALAPPVLARQADERVRRNGNGC